MRTAPPDVLRGQAGELPLRPDDRAAHDLAMLIEGETSGRPLEEVLAKWGRSRSTYYEKLQKFREEGLQGLLPGRPGPRGPWRRTLEVVQRIVRARLEDALRPSSSIAAELRAAGHNVSVRSIERTLQQFGLTHAARR